MIIGKRALRSAVLVGVAAAAFIAIFLFKVSFPWIVAGAPHVEGLRQNRRLSGALAGVTAAVVGVILNLSAWFGLHTLFARLEVVRFVGMTYEIPVWESLETGALLLSAGALVAMLRFKVGMPRRWQPARPSVRRTGYGAINE